MRRGRSAPSVPVTVRENLNGTSILFRVLPFTSTNQPWLDLRTVFLGGHEMGQHAAPVEAFPMKRVKGKAAELIEREFRGEEIAYAAARKKLGQGRGETEDVRQPAGGHVEAEFLLEETRAHQDLPDQTLAARDVAVGLGSYRRTFSSTTSHSASNTLRASEPWQPP